MKWAITRIKIVILFCSLFIAVCANTLFAQEEILETFVFGSVGGGRPAGSISRSQSVNIQQSDIIQQVDDTLYLLRKDTIYSIALNSDTDAPSEILSEIQVDVFPSGYDPSHWRLLATDDFVIVISLYDKEINFEFGERISFYRVNNGSQLEFLESYFKPSFDGFGNSMTVVDNNLVSVVSKDIYEGATVKDFKNMQHILPIQRQLAQSQEKSTVNITRSVRWSNSIRAAIKSRNAAAVFKCPLDDFANTGLKCDISVVLGAYNHSYYISPNAVYLSSPFYTGSNTGVASLSTNELLQRTDNVIDSTRVEEKSAFYRVSLDFNDVTAVLFDGLPLSHFSFEEINDSFSALITRPSVAGDDNDSVYGLTFSLDQFSHQPILLSQSDYHFLTSYDGRISANNFSDTKIVLAKTNYDDDPSYQLLVWDIESDEVLSSKSDFEISGLYYQGDNLLAIGLNDDESSLMLQTWSIGSEIQSLFFQHYPHYEPFSFRDHAKSFTGPNFSQSTWGLPIYRHDKDGNTVDYLAEAGNDYYDVVDIAYFKTKDDGSVVDLGPVFAKPFRSKDECKSACNSWYGLEQPLVVENSIYSLTGNQIIKGSITKDEINEHGYLNLVPSFDDKNDD